MNLCKYKDILGKPNEGVHSYRMCNFAIVDILATIIGGILIAHLFNFNKKNTIIVLFLIGIILHRLFCVETTVDRILFSYT